MSDAQPAQSSLRSRVEWLLIPAGLLLLHQLTPHEIRSDGAFRFRALELLLRQGELSPTTYSMLGPLLAAPLWGLGELFHHGESWVARFNWALLALASLGFAFGLRGWAPPPVVRRFLLVLVYASMFGRHQMDFFGEVFTALAAGLGVVAVLRGRAVVGSLALCASIVNTPATGLGAALVAAGIAIRDRRVRWLLVPVGGALLVLAESWIRRGSPFATGYEADLGLETIMPYSGLPGFSYPLAFGALSLLLSFGKGVLWFAPGLLLPVHRLRGGLSSELVDLHRLWLAYVVGLLLVYAGWWAWYGGWFWGPRFLLAASLPASLAIAVSLSRPDHSGASALATLAALLWSCWVAVSGVLFDQQGLEICTAQGWALEALCWYTPEWSVLFHPFVSARALRAGDWTIALATAAVFALLAWPLVSLLTRSANAQLQRALRWVHQGGWRI